jgi:CubicO group peptidase (beta-lactamase class C family)
MESCGDLNQSLGDDVYGVTKRGKPMPKLPRTFSSLRFLLLCFICSLWAIRSVAQTPQTLDIYLKQTFTSIPGAAVSVVHHGAIVFEGGYGHADAEKKTLIDSNTRFELASVTKQITAMAVMMEKEAGRFRYDTPVTQFFPEFNGFAQGVTIRNLLQHTGGFPDYSELCRGSGPARNEDLVKLIVKESKLEFPPGTRSVYSNTGYALLAVLIERTSGLSYPDFLEQKIFTPLGMKETFVNRWGIPPKTNLARSYNNPSTPAESPGVLNCNTIYGDGSVFSTAHDMALWNLYLEKNTVVGTAASMEEAYQPVSETAPYGFGWGLRPLSGMKQYSHTGAWAGYRTLNARFPDKEFAVVILTNAPGANLNAVLQKAIDLYLR